MLHKCLNHAKNKYTLLSAIWKVYSILLEYCCKSNYQMLIAKIGTEHQLKLEEMEEDFNKEIRQLNQNEKELKLSLDDINRENGELRK
mmetsp:Transcript_5036/g.6173  ORF Transcript_5036/g.6173 Transcript_5036/m.6173 type:complete len:88 (-) Transcript_5036:1082-1345(-)